MRGAAEVVENCVIDANARPEVEPHAQVAASLVVTLSVVCVVPAASWPEGEFTVTVGGVGSAME